MLTDTLQTVGKKWFAITVNKQVTSPATVLRGGMTTMTDGNVERELVTVEARMII